MSVALVQRRESARFKQSPISGATCPNETVEFVLQMSVTGCMKHGAHPADIQPTILRLSKLMALGEGDIETLRIASGMAFALPAGRALSKLDQEASNPAAVLGGWLARVRQGRDGKRQILDIYLPGDIITPNPKIKPYVAGAIVAVHDVHLCQLPASLSDTLSTALLLSRQLDEERLLRQIYRVGRMTASERIYDWMIETGDRLRVAGLAGENEFMLPLRQDLVADILALTAVHLNRTLKDLRLSGKLTWRLGKVRISPDQTVRSRHSPFDITHSPEAHRSDYG
ncbi:MULTISPECIES: Crp/Fnr family transcriptional regulator [Sphingomonas]|uniref:Crp/Fnr family transcriptional regulator n=1 Tax=Sphingomonas TaxID=13687 RepID=UPI0012EE15FF|nr:Crp/Fnr family transcriptional regulator [Sphingomonas pituitosa]